MIVRYMLMFAMLGAAAFCYTVSEATPPDAMYTTRVQLSNGKTLSCEVNPPDNPQQAPGILTATEQREAEVIATSRLRLLSGPRSGYPTAYTAPHVICRPAR
ncbi:MAG TPA: hypothetical protein VGE93_24500 [Bryobacteraceae bacterium]